MQRIATALSLTLALALSGACAPAAPPEPDTEAMIAAAEALDQQFLAAFNAGDGAAMAALYAEGPDTVSFPPDAMVMRGSDAVREGMAGFATAMAGAQLQVLEGHHVVVGDAVASWGLFTITMPAPDESAVGISISGRYTDLKAERDGRWVYLMDHASVPMPAPEEEMAEE
jgi:uncharacterized protein (TIGR02246 family)